MGRRGYFFILILSGSLLYLNSLFNGFIGDDFDQIVNNNLIQSGGNLGRIFSGSTYFRNETGQSYGFYYRPMMILSFSVIYRLFGPDPFFFHLASIIIHISNCLLFFALLSKYTSYRNSFLASLFFLVHPVNSEAVLYIANFQDLLFVFFGLLSLVLTVRSNGKYPDICAILVLLSMLSKETGVMFLILNLLYLWFFTRKKFLKYLTSAFVSFAVFLVLRFAVSGYSLNTERLTPVGTAPLGIRLMNIPAIIAEFMKNLALPLKPEINQMWLVRSITLEGFIIPLLISLIGFLYLLRSIRGQVSKFFFSWALISLLLHIHIIPLDSTYSDRWFYPLVMPLLGMTALNLSKKDGRMLIIAGLLLISAYSGLTFRRTFNFRDEITLFTNDLSNSKGNYYLENSLASIYIRNGEYSRAKPLVISSVSGFEYFGNLNNMAVIYNQEGNYELSEEYFLKAVSKGGDYTVYRNFANYLVFIKKDYRQAENFLRRAVDSYPQSREFFLMLALTYYRMGNNFQSSEILKGILNFRDDEKIESFLKKIQEGRSIGDDEVKLIINGKS